MQLQGVKWKAPQEPKGAGYNWDVGLVLFRCSACEDSQVAAGIFFRGLQDEYDQITNSDHWLSQLSKDLAFCRRLPSCRPVAAHSFLYSPLTPSFPER